MTTPGIIVYIPGTLRQYSGGAGELRLTAGTVREALAELERTQPILYRNVCDETGAVRRHLNIFVNTSHVRDLGGIDTALSAGDEITILPAVSGG